MITQIDSLSPQEIVDAKKHKGDNGNDKDFDMPIKIMKDFSPRVLSKRVLANFRLKSDSPATDAGMFLTTTKGNGIGADISVYNVRYFCDGFGLIEGDDIMVGSNKVTAVDIDYDANLITVNKLISWSDGEPVSLIYSDSAPDIGICDFLPFYGL